MTCHSCSQHVEVGNIRALVKQAADMTQVAGSRGPNRREARIHFRRIFTTFFDSLISTHKIEPSHIFDLQMLRMGTDVKKCEIRQSHHILGECADIAYVDVLDRGTWHPSCLICAAHVLEMDEIKDVIRHEDVRNLGSGRRSNPQHDDGDSHTVGGITLYSCPSCGSEDTYPGLCYSCDWNIKHGWPGWPEA
jgi:hypothetical protein